MSIKDHVQGRVEFQYFQDGNLWYLTTSGFTFPVPVSDTGSATFWKTDKAMMFMRWIRKHMAVIEAKNNDHDEAMRPAEGRL